MIFHFKKTIYMVSKKKNWVTEGMDVAHIDNLGKKMQVEKLIYAERKFHDGERERIKRLFNGVRCHWWGPHPEMPKEKILNHSDFHTNELVPWDVAVKGENAVLNFQYEIYKNK